MFSENLKLLIETNGMRQKDLAAFVDVKPNTVSDWIKQGNSPKIEHLCRISEYFDVSLDWLIASRGEMYRKENFADTTIQDKFNRLNESEKILVLERIQTLLDLKEPPTSQAVKAASAKEPMSVSARRPETEPRIIDIRVFDQRASAGLGSYLSGESTYEVLSVSAEVLPPKADFGIRIRGDSMEPDIPDNSVVWVKEQLELDNGQIGVFTLNNEEAFCKKLKKDYKNNAVYLISLNPKYDPMKLSEGDFLRTVGCVIGEPYFF